MSAESLRLAMKATQTHLAQLAREVEGYEAVLASAEAATAVLAHERTRIKTLRTAPDDLVAAAAALLDKLDTMTTEDFAHGAERDEREGLRAVLEIRLFGVVRGTVARMFDS